MVAVEHFMKALSHNVPRDIVSLQRVTDLTAALPGLRRIHLRLTDDAVCARDAPGGCEWLWPREISPPQHAFADEGGLPFEDRRAVLYIHGGAMVLCNPATHRLITAGIARATCAHVLAIGYRRPPEHRYPAALDDTMAAYQALRELVPAERIIVAGESAGANLAMALCLQLRDQGLPLPGGLALVSPWIDLTDASGSFAMHGGKDFVPTDLLLEFAEAYAPDEATRANSLVSPLRAQSLKGMPPSLVIYGDTERLAPQGRDLVRKLKDAGCDVQEYLGNDMVHGFPAFGEIAYGGLGHRTVLFLSVVFWIVVCVGVGFILCFFKTADVYGPLACLAVLVVATCASCYRYSKARRKRGNNMRSVRMRTGSLRVDDLEEQSTQAELPRTAPLTQQHTLDLEAVSSAPPPVEAVRRIGRFSVSLWQSKEPPKMVMMG